MGSRSFIKSAIAPSAREAWDKLVEQAIYENGNDCYSGDVNTCGLGRCTKTYDRWSPENETAAKEIIRRDDYGERRIAKCIDLGVYQWVHRSVKKTSYKPDAKHALKYVIVESFYNKPDEDLGKYDKKVDADKAAVEWAMKGKDVEVRMKYVRVSGNDLASTFAITEKKYDKPHKVPAGAKETVMHKYLFYGWAAE